MSWNFVGRRTALAALGVACLAADAGAYTIYVSNEKDNTVSVIDSDKLAVVATWKVGRRPRGVTLSLDGKWLYVCASDDNRVDVVDTATGKVVRNLRSGPDPELFILHPKGNPLYIANEDDNMVTVVDVETNRVLAEVPVGVEPEGMGISPDGAILVNTSETTNMAHFIDTKSFQVIGNVLVDARPRIAEFSPDGKTLWVSSEVGGTVSVIDPVGRRIIKKIGFLDPRHDEGGHPAGRRAADQGWQESFRGLGARQPRGGDRCRDDGSGKISARRSAGLAACDDARREAPDLDERSLQRYLDHRCGGREGAEEHQGRRISVGRCREPEIGRGPPLSESAATETVLLSGRTIWAEKY